MTTALFLTPEELRQLTGFALKAKQIECLRIMGIAFHINGHGRPVVTRATVEGRSIQHQAPVQTGWQPAVVGRHNNAA